MLFKLGVEEGNRAGNPTRDAPCLARSPRLHFHPRFLWSVSYRSLIADDIDALLRASLIYDFSKVCLSTQIHLSVQSRSKSLSILILLQVMSMTSISV